MANQNVTEHQMILDFIGVTGVDEERANFFLQSSNWDLPTALEMFYDDSSDNQFNQISHAEPPNVDPVEIPNSEYSANGSSSKSSSSARKKDGNVFTLSSYQDGVKTEGEEGQAYYAGGSEHSGQQILGPDKKSKNTTQKLFEAARQHGAESVTEKSTDKKKGNNVFRGAGYKLGSDIEPSQQVSESLSMSNELIEPQNVIIKFWSNGFSVDSGPLRDFNDPSNKNFLDSIAKGEVPAELRGLARNSEVHVNMEDHREQEYIKPKETLKAFSGKGQMLGSPTPTIVQQEILPSTKQLINNEDSTFRVNESKPVTSIQIRLSDGTRLVIKFNHENTVGDIRNAVRNARPNIPNFNLMTTFPNKILDNDNITIAAAKLLNAVIVQRAV